MDYRDGLVAEYLFTGNAHDTSRQGKHGVVHGARLTADRFGNPDCAFAFDGVDDYIEVTPPPSFSQEAMSISVWWCAEPRDFRGWTNCIVAQDDGNDEDQARRVFQLSTFDGRIVWHRMVGARDPINCRRVLPGVWCHVVATHEHGVNRLYVDGRLVDSVEHGLWTHAHQPLHIGRKGTDESFFFFQGSIDDVRIYDCGLDEDHVQLLLREGGWIVPPEGPPLPGDPLSGHWGREGVVYLDVGYDGKERVTGRIMAGEPHNMATIANGSFARTSGALHLAGDAVHHRTRLPVTWSIDGTLDSGELMVVARVKGSQSNYQGNFKLTRAGASLRLTRQSLRSHLGALAYRFRHQ